MAKNDTNASFTSPAVGVYPAPRDETKKLSFWVSQIFILLATVVGVYLASSQGFKQAVAYGELQSAKTNYFLRQSLRNEIGRNIPLVRAYADAIGTGSPSARNQPINLDTFVWDCMANSSATLETPPELLSESRKFYRDVADIRKLIADQTIAIGVGKERLDAVLAHMEKDVLPKFDADIQALKKHLKDNNITVE